MEQDLVSIIVPTFNRAKLLIETLTSIVNQTYKNWECILVDDGSTDEVANLVNEFILKDHRFKFFKRPIHKPKGANACRNFGFEKSKGDYIKFFDSDDLMKPELIEKQFNFLVNRSYLDFCATFWIHLYEDGSTMKNKQNTHNYKDNPIRGYLLDSHIFPTPSPLWRRSFLENKELFDEKLHKSQEADFHFKMLMYQPKYDFLNDFLMYIRIGHESIKTNISNTSRMSVFKYFNNVFLSLSKSNNQDKKMLLEYVFYRQSVNYYNLICNTQGIFNKLRVSRTIFPNLLNYEKQAGVNKKMNLLIGKLLLLLFNKGYYFFYYPKFNYRNKN